MSKPIDISPEAVARYVANLRKDDADDWESHAKSADLLSALSAALSEARGKVGEAERERDEATKYAKTLCESFVHEHCSPVETWKVLPDLIGVLTQIYNATTVVRSIKAERDAALSELAKLRKRTTKLSIDYIVALDEKGRALNELEKLRAEAEWRPIESAPTGKLAYQQIICGHAEKKWIRFGRRLPGQNDWYYSGTNERSQWAEQTGDAPTHFRPLPSPPKDPAHD